MKLKEMFSKSQEAAPVKRVDDEIDDGNSSSSSGDENKERGNWSNQFEFLLSCVSYAVGLGNIWRFPYLCMRNGGGAFLIPYFTFMLVCGMPLFYLELALGQFSSLSVISVWNLSALFKGVGLATVIVTGIVCIYYNVIIAWVLYYLFHSFTSSLPWGSCGHAWNTDRCYVRSEAPTAAVVEAVNTSVINATLFNEAEAFSLYNALNITSFHGNVSSNHTAKYNTPAEEFWHYNVLQMSSGIGEFGGIQWKLCGAHALGWLLVFLCIIKGVKSSGKVVYVTASVPYLFLTIMLIRGLTLPGAVDGIKYYVTPEWNRLLEFKVWVEACLQIFYSLGPGWGSLITMASYNRFHNRLHVDAAIVPAINCGTSFFAGFVIFSIIGVMAKDAGVKVEDVVTSGPGLAFVAYPEALNKLPISPMWAIMFFLMLLNIGLGTQFAMVQTIASGFMDYFPRVLKVFKRKWVFTAFVCFSMFVLSIPFVTRAGIYYFQIVDWYSAAFSVSVIAVFECVIVCLIYGVKRIAYDIECMIGSKPSILLMAFWTCVTPLSIVLVIIASMNNFPQPYYGDYTYPPWAIGLGWFLASISLVPIPVYAIWLVARTEGPLLQRLRKLTRPEPTWGPALPKHREFYKYSANISEKLMKSQGKSDTNELDIESCI